VRGGRVEVWAAVEAGEHDSVIFDAAAASAGGNIAATGFSGISTLVGHLGVPRRTRKPRGRDLDSHIGRGCFESGLRHSPMPLARIRLSAKPLEVEIAPPTYQRAIGGSGHPGTHESVTANVA